jgi:hypothetical protein
MGRFWKWLFRNRHPGTKKCVFCGRRQPVETMYRHPVHGWFCNEGEYEDYWGCIQW